MSAFGSIPASENDIPQLLYWMGDPKASEPPNPATALIGTGISKWPDIHSLRRMSMIDTFKVVTLTRRIYFWAGLWKAGRFDLEEGTMGKGTSLRQGLPAR